MTLCIVYKISIAKTDDFAIECLDQDFPYFVRNSDFVNAGHPGLLSSSYWILWCVMGHCNSSLHITSRNLHTNLTLWHVTSTTRNLFETIFWWRQLSVCKNRAFLDRGKSWLSRERKPGRNRTFLDQITPDFRLSHHLWVKNSAIFHIFVKYRCGCVRKSCFSRDKDDSIPWHVRVLLCWPKLALTTQKKRCKNTRSPSVFKFVFCLQMESLSLWQTVLSNA